jgi:hypothetical protein
MIPVRLIYAIEQVGPRRARECAAFMLRMSLSGFVAYNRV